MAVTFSDGFESGNTSAWSTVVGSPTVQSTVVQEYADALLCTAGEGVSHTIAGGNRTVALRFWFRFDANPTVARAIVGGYTTSSNVNLQLKTTGVISLFDGTTEVDTGPTLLKDTWYRADILLDTTANPWVASWFVDGLDQGSSNIAHAAADITAFSVGNTGTGVTNLYIDNVSMSLLSSDYRITNTGLDVRCTSSGTFGSAASVATTLPVGWVAGDIFVIILSFSAAASLVGTVTSTGWAAVPSTTNPKDSGSSCGTAMYRVAQGGDTDPTFSWPSGSTSGAWGIWSILGASGSSPFVVNTENSGAASLNHVCLGVTPGVTNSLLLCVACSDNPGVGITQVYTKPVSMIEDLDPNAGLNRATLDGSSLVLASGSATGNKTATVATSTAFVSFTMTLRPPGSVPHDSGADVGLNIPTSGEISFGAAAN